MDKDKETQETEMARKRKDLQEELTAAKKRKKELEVSEQKLAESADKKAKEAEKITNVATMKKLLIESNASRKISEEIMMINVPKQEEEIKEMEKKLKTSKLSRNSFLDQLSITKMCSNMLDIFISVLLLEY